MTKLLTAAIALLLCAVACTAQSIISPIRFTNYTVADGLPSNTVNHIMEDSRGFTWMSTAQGLARFDGQNFRIYSHTRADSNSMPSSSVNNCIELKNHELLFSSGSHLWILNPYSHRQHPPPLFWKNKKWAISNLLSNELIAVLCDAGVYFTNMDLEVIDSIPNPLLVHQYDILYLGANKILFCDHHKTIIYSLEDKKTVEWKIPTDSFKLDKVYYLKNPDSLLKTINIATFVDGTYEMSYDAASPNYLKPIQLPPGTIGHRGEIKTFAGNKIAWCDNNLFIQQPSQLQIKLENIPGDNSTIFPGNIWSIFAGNNGNYWATGDNGISRFSLQQQHYQSWKLPYASVIDQYRKKDDKIWMSSEHTGSLYLDTKTGQLQVIDSTLIRYCWGAVPVGNQIYMYGNSVPPVPFNTKLLAYNPLTKKITSPSFLQPFYHNAELITMVYQSHNGDVWYSLNYGNGLVRQQAGSNNFVQYRMKDVPQPFTFGYVNKAAEDRNGNLYFTTNKKIEVLVWKNKKTHFEEWQMDSVLNRKDVQFGPLWAHLIDGKQNLWLAYEQIGLVKYNLETHLGKLYETEDGLPTNWVRTMEADADNNIWLPSEKGLSCLLSATDKIITFTEKDGLPFTDFSDSYLFYDKDDSSLYFSKTVYLYKINCAHLLQQRRQENIRLVIDDITVNARPYFFSDAADIQLAPGENNVAFSFTLLNIENKIRQGNIEYLLTSDNGKQQWQALSGGNSIAFYSMKPGAYSLQLRMLNDATNEYVSSNIFHFTIATIWYNQWWFRLLIAAAFIGIVLLIARAYYLHKIEKEKAIIEKEIALADERSRIAADMHDDVGAGLSRIRYITTAMKEGKEHTDDKINKILALSDESVEKMNEIIWSLNQGNQPLQELIYHIRSQCAEMVSNANIEFACTMPDDMPNLTMDWKQTRNIYLLVKEAVNNAIKHAAAANISITFNINHSLHICIKDDGRGFNENKVRKQGNGLLNYKKRVESLVGTYTLETGEGKGTELCFSIPLHSSLPG